MLEGRIKLTLIDAPGELVTVLAVTHDGITTTTTGVKRMAYTLPADKQVELKIAYQDSNGNPASIDGQISWDSSDPNIASIMPGANPQPDNSAVILRPGSGIGNCQVSARADADLGSGVRELVTLMDITVVGGEAVTGTITPGEATAITPAQGTTAAPAPAPEQPTKRRAYP